MAQRGPFPISSGARATYTGSREEYGNAKANSGVARARSGGAGANSGGEKLNSESASPGAGRRPRLPVPPAPDKVAVNKS